MLKALAFSACDGYSRSDLSTPPRGIVYLVGAGPGDPGLLTLRGAELLKSADVVVYDYLANPRLLSHCPQARQIYVGKKAGHHSMSQEQINELLIEQARAGKQVVRLKGGDPFVFGRGGEECQALAAAGVPFEVVPGVTAAVAAPAYAGIPVTHRQFNSSFTLVTGHEGQDGSAAAPGHSGGGASGASEPDWSALARLPCLAFYMGVKSLPEICRNLIAHGMPPDMPAATIRWGTTPRQQTIVGTLADLPQRVQDAGIGPPAMTLVGRVVTLRQTLNWFEDRPLFGQTVVVTRTRQQASELSRRLAEAGADIVEAPTIELIEPADWTAVDEVLKSIGAFDWVVFTSQNGVRFTRKRLGELKLDARAFGNARIAAIGPATAQAVAQELFLSVDLCPKAFVAEALADALSELKEVKGRRFVLLRADIARPVLRQRLLADGAAEVRDVPVYETRPAQSLPSELLTGLRAGQIHWITFTSSSTARNFMAMLGEAERARLASVRLASIGPVTSATLRELGLVPSVEARQFDMDGLVEAIIAQGAVR